MSSPLVIKEEHPPIDVPLGKGCHPYTTSNNGPYLRLLDRTIARVPALEREVKLVRQKTNPAEGQKIWLRFHDIDGYILYDILSYLTHGPRRMPIYRKRSGVVNMRRYIKACKLLKRLELQHIIDELVGKDTVLDMRGLEGKVEEWEAKIEELKRKIVEGRKMRALENNMSKLDIETST